MNQYRDVSWVLQKFRKVLLGREYKDSLRRKGHISSRSPPHPMIPGW